MAKYFGVRDSDGISYFYKAVLTQADKSVVGYISECTLESSQIWTSPFEGDTAGNAGGAEKLSGIGQTQSQMTTKTLWNSSLVWEGAETLEFQLTLEFIAYADAVNEVDLAVQTLLQFSAPELKDMSPTGQIPQEVILNLGRRVCSPILIRSVSYDENVPRDPSGSMTHATVTLTCILRNVLNASNVANVFK